MTRIEVVWSAIVQCVSGYADGHRRLAVCLLATALGAAVATDAQSIHSGGGTVEARIRTEREEQDRRRWGSANLTMRRELAHKRMEPSAALGAEPECPVLSSVSKAAGKVGLALPRPFAARYAASRPSWRATTPPAESATSLFSEYVSGPVIQGRCANCHVEGACRAIHGLCCTTRPNPITRR